MIQVQVQKFTKIPIKFEASDLNKKDTRQFVIERDDRTKQEDVAATIELILIEPAVGSNIYEKDDIVITHHLTSLSLTEWG